MGVPDNGFHRCAGMYGGELTHMQMPTAHTGAYLEEVQSASEPDCGLESLTGQVLPIHGSLKRCQGPKNWPRRGDRRIESVRFSW